MTIRQLRLLRAAAASSVATLLAAVSHTVAGGSAPHPLLIVGVAVLLVPLVAVLIGAKLSKARTALVVLVSQAAFHVTFQELGAPTVTNVISFGHQHGPPVLGEVSVAALPDALMVAGHVLAAIVTTALLWHGESVVRAIAGWMLALLLVAVALVPADHRRPALLVSHRHPLVDAVHGGAISRRGPPQHS